MNLKNFLIAGCVAFLSACVGTKTMQTGNIAAREKLTGRLYFQRIGAPSFVDFGNVTLVKREPKIDRAQQLTNSRGRVRVTHEAISKIHPLWTLKLDEHSGPTLQLLNLATEKKELAIIHADAKHFENLQLAFDPETVEFQPVQVQLTPESSDEEHLDEIDMLVLFILDESGAAVLAQGWANYGENPLVLEDSGYGVSGSVHVNWSQDLPEGRAPLKILKTYVQNSEAFVRGAARLVLSDQNAVAAKKIYDFPAELRTTEQGENDGQKFNEFSLELLATGDITVLTRETELPFDEREYSEP